MALRPFHVIELCAGAGGLGLGIELAVPGARPVCMVEREAFAAATLVGRMEAGDLAPAPVWSDLATFDGRPWRGRVHCVASGDPCQGNSVAGKQLGADDPRFLAGPVLRIVDQVRPLRFFRENVRGNVDGQLEAFVPALERMGYRVECGIFSSGETGASHRRDRFFLMADADGWDACAEREQRGWEQRLLARRDGAVDDSERAQRGTVSNARGPEGPHIRARGWHEGAARARASGEAVDDALRGRHGDTLETLQSGRHGAVDASRSALGHAPRVGRRKGRPEPELRSGRDAAASNGGAMADARRAEPQGQQSGQCDAQGRQEPDGYSPLCGRAGLPLFAPGPSDPRWPGILAAAPELEPALCRVAHAVADRVDRLRLLGNGVDPVAAAYAWLCLDARHRAHRAAVAGSASVSSAA